MKNETTPITTRLIPSKIHAINAGADESKLIRAKQDIRAPQRTQIIDRIDLKASLFMSTLLSWK